MWTSVAVALLFVGTRLYIRRSRNLLAWDDLIVGISLSLFVASSSIWQSVHRAIYIEFDLTNGSARPTPANLAALVALQRRELGTLILFYTGLWSIKLAFLIFFRTLILRVWKVKIWWWVVLGLVAATYCTCLGTIQYQCLIKDIEYILSALRSDPGGDRMADTSGTAQCPVKQAIHFQDVTLRYLMAVDVLTDICSEPHFSFGSSRTVVADHFTLSHVDSHAGHLRRQDRTPAEDHSHGDVRSYNDHYRHRDRARD